MQSLERSGSLRSVCASVELARARTMRARSHGVGLRSELDDMVIRAHRQSVKGARRKRDKNGGLSVSQVVKENVCK